ncbi:MAG: hypothetical protein MUD12_13150 [Spirochaetes bacterium]|jgi:hypothetical protein|nr:hypothetical protein [Spirochaetota bacterium]
MLDNLKRNIIPHMFSLGLMVMGWYISILNVGLSRFQENVLFTKWTLIGLILIIVGAYLPHLWNSMRKKP